MRTPLQLSHIMLKSTWALYIAVLYYMAVLQSLFVDFPAKTKMTNKYELFDCLQHAAAVTQECFPGGDCQCACCCAACMTIATPQLQSMHSICML